MQKSESIAKLAEALSIAQGEFKAVPKESSNPFFKSKYADLGTVIDAIRGPLAKHGLSYVQLPSIADSMVCVTTMLMHSSGEWISEELRMPTSKNDAQGVGSAVTYARRYALQSIVGVAAEEDDDGNGAVSKAKPKAAEKCEQIGSTPSDFLPAPKLQPTVNLPIHGCISEGQMKRLFALARERGWEKPELVNLIGKHGFEHSNEITVKAYDGIIDAIAARPLKAVTQ